jgi:multimeric flavodoxin WrbA
MHGFTLGTPTHWDQLTADMEKQTPDGYDE